jgi:hypothetical protein
MFGIYYALSAIAVMSTFGFDMPPVTRLYMYFFIGLTVFGIFGSFTYYLPELFPTRLRGTGAGFCYNVGRVVAAAGPFLVGTIASRGADASRARCCCSSRRGAARRLSADRPSRRDQGPRSCVAGRGPLPGASPRCLPCPSACQGQQVDARWL